MSSKILVADDSLTIQKVIGITLANSGYELTECTKEEDLISKVKSNEYDLVLLDFNLSEQKSGYELSLEIKKILPKAGLIIMLGTFDTVDESKFSDYGINDKIIKPFESAKFIKKCKDVLDNVVEFEPPVTLSKPIVVEEIDEERSLDSWIVDAPKKEEVDFSADTEFNADDVDSQLNLDPLKSEIMGWGFAPSEDLEQKFNKEFPPVIEELPTVEILERLQTSSSFVENQNSFESEVVSTDDDTDPNFQVPLDLNRDLLSSIDEEVSAEAFWAVDEIVPIKSEESEQISETRLDEVTADLTDTVAAFKKHEAELSLDLSSKSDVPHSEEKLNIDMDLLVTKLQAALLPKIEQMVREYCKETATKVSWEVIPDLAENLIKKEIKEISDSIH
jgi:CheY-like chemotaxis protein